MKKVVLFAVILFTAASCGNNRRARVSGTFSGKEKDTVYLQMVTTQDRKIVDSAVISRKGDFRFNVQLPGTSPTFFNLICQGSVIPLILSPREKVTVRSMLDLSHNYTVEGSEDSRLIREFNTLYWGGVTTLDSLSYLFSEMLPTAENEQRRRDLLQQYTQEYLKIKRGHIAFIVEHAKSMAALYALYQRLPNDQSLFSAKDDYIYYRMVADSLSSEYPQSPHVLALKRDADAQMDALNLLQKVDEQLNNPQNYPDLDLADMFGKKHKLSSLDGKVILLDFWSATSDASLVFNAELKELYSEFAPRGFEVYQVSLDNSKSRWVESVQSQKLPWISVNDFAGIRGTAPASYNISGIPANILIDKQGAIVGRNVYGDRLKNKLSELTK